MQKLDTKRMCISFCLSKELSFLFNIIDFWGINASDLIELFPNISFWSAMKMLNIMEIEKLKDWLHDVSFNELHKWNRSLQWCNQITRVLDSRYIKGMKLQIVKYVRIILEQK